jgi:hypothetical protein
VAGAPALTDLLAGRVQVMFENLPTSLEYIRAGKLRALGVTTSDRSDLLPELPTVSEIRARLRGQFLVWHRRAEECIRGHYRFAKCDNQFWPLRP